MKHTQTKFFIMFLTGILFSALSVFAATITVNTDFGGDAVQFLQQLVLTDSDGTTTGVLLNGSGESYIMGNVGMGVSNPQVKLHIKNDTNNANDIFLVEALGGEDLLSVDGDTSGYPIIKIGDMGDLAGGHFLTVEDGKSYFQNGNVGIGTDNPTAALTIKGTTTTDSLHVLGYGSLNNIITVKGDPNRFDQEIVLGDPENVGDIGNIVKITDDKTTFQNGNVGIGTDSPEKILDVIGETRLSGSVDFIKGDGSLHFSEGGFSIVTASDGPPDISLSMYPGEGDFVLSNGSNIFTITARDGFNFAGGNVGIGTEYPQATLDVNGSIKIGSDGDTCTINNAGTLRYVEPTGDTSHLEICALAGDTTPYAWRLVQAFTP